MKQLLIILSLVLGCLQPGYTQKPVLKFNKDGKFKIVQFTDVHYIHGNPKSAVSLERINEVLDAEKPDLVVFTGDVIYGQPAEEGMRTILNLAANRQIPFGVTFGNHDDEQGLTRTQLFDIIQTMIPPCGILCAARPSRHHSPFLEKNLQILYIFASGRLTNSDVLV